MADHQGPPLRGTLSQLRLRELLLEVQDRIEQLVASRDKIDALPQSRSTRRRRRW